MKWIGRFQSEEGRWSRCHGELKSSRGHMSGACIRQTSFWSPGSNFSSLDDINNLAISTQRALETRVLGDSGTLSGSQLSKEMVKKERKRNPIEHPPYSSSILPGDKTKITEKRV